jgi:diguanylate cyclase (GGDEF)-like protein
MRSEDFLARWGGEEFVLLLPDTSKSVLTMVAERIRKAIENTPSKTQAHDEIPVTVSLGIATYPEDGNKASSVLSAADKALYRAKDNGRNYAEKA